MTKAETLEFVASEGETTAMETARAFGVDEHAAAMLLMRLWRQGLLARRGRGGGFGGVYVYALTERGTRRLAYWRR